MYYKGFLSYVTSILSSDLPAAATKPGHGPEAGEAARQLEHDVQHDEGTWGPGGRRGTRPRDRGRGVDVEEKDWGGAGVIVISVQNNAYLLTCSLSCCHTENSPSYSHTTKECDDQTDPFFYPTSSQLLTECHVEVNQNSSELIQFHRYEPCLVLITQRKSY